jgi:hypothetical protein
MNQKLIIMLLVVGFGVSGCASIGPKFEPSVITFRDGTVRQGGTDIINNYRFRFKDDKTGKHKWLKNEDVSSIEKTTLKGKKLNYKTITYKKNDMLVKHLVSGEFNLYEFLKISYTAVSTNNGTNAVKSYNFIKFFSIKDQALEIYEIKGTFSDKLNLVFKQFTQKHLTDAPELINKIGTVGYEYKDYIKVFEEYNQIKQKQ